MQTLKASQDKLTFVKCLNFKLLRLFSLSAVASNKNASREAKFFSKMLSGPKKKKKILSFEPITTASNFQHTGKSSQKKPILSHTSSKRMIVLNKLIMRNITDVIATEGFMEKLDPYGIVVTNVCISCDFHIANVLWVSTKPSAVPENIDKILHPISLALQNELNWLHIMGNFPIINFIPDKKELRILELNNAMKKIEFPPEDIDITSCEEADTIEVWPEMTHDIYGLQHSRIMHKVMGNSKCFRR